MSAAMDKRLELHAILCELLGSNNVYFQPPETIKMNYPAIVYGLDGIRNQFADNRIYRSTRRYSVTVIDKDPDTELIDKILTLPKCQFNRHFESDNLNHDVFTLYY